MYKCRHCQATHLCPDSNGVITCSCGYINMADAFIPMQDNAEYIDLDDYFFEGAEEAFYAADGIR